MGKGEVWKPVVGYEGLYEVSNMGNVRSLDRTIPYKSDGRRAIAYGRILRAFPNGGGYYRVNLCNNGKRKAHFVHRIVAEAFIDNPLQYSQINHKDENKANNAAYNLEWCNAKYNTNYGTRNQRASIGIRLKKRRCSDG